jgi:hypothetical protein
MSLQGSNPGKRLNAIRLNEKVKIDGKLDEAIWSTAEKGSDFTQTEPNPGNVATFSTDVYFLYDNNAVYIGARMYDPEPDKILKELSLRDVIGNADNFRVFLDTYKSGLNGFKFYVTSSGVQLDAVVTNNIDDNNWNAIWTSAVSQDKYGWYAEIMIPYSSLRFPSKPEQEWNVQFGREIRRLRETSYWSYINPAMAGWVQQSGQVVNIKNIETPVRLSLTPYVSGYLNTTYDPIAQSKKFTSATAYSAGLDLKYGINDAFTLDMTLVPDFGQVISDKQVLNLSPFEVFFDENRQFFTEGTELFNRGNLFYSRRVGGRPIHYNRVNQALKDNETILSNPESTQLYNATKISGRTSKGVGLGLFNAIVGEEHAVIIDEDGKKRSFKTSPLTNYNAIVIDKNLKNNSFVSVINTNVSRKGEDYDANVTGGFFNFKTKDQKYFIGGSGVISRQYYAEDINKGHTYSIALGKISGNWTYELAHGSESDKYNPNDMGFLFSPNEVIYSTRGQYTQYKPSNTKIQQYSVNANVTYARLYKPNVFNDFYITSRTFVLYKSRNAFGINARFEPIVTHDYFEPRTPDFSRHLNWPKNYMLGGFISTDYRKPFAFDISAAYRYFDIANRDMLNTSFSPRVRFSDQLSLFSSLALTVLHYEPGYVNKNLETRSITGVESNDILIGRRNRLIFENSLTGKYIFNSKMGINVRIRHYWDRVVYKEFGTLRKDGDLNLLSYNGQSNVGNPIFDRNVNIFNIDLQYNWRFAPGSDIILVWKNQIFNSDKEYQRDYFSNLGGLFDSQQTNNFSIRVLYYLDYLYAFARKEA